MTESAIKGIRIEYEGVVAGLNTRALNAAAIAGVLRPFSPDVNLVNAPVVAKDKGIAFEEVRRASAGNVESLIRITVDAEDMPRHAAGTVFQDGKPRVIEIRGITVDAEFAPHMIYVRNADQPGFIGQFGSVLGEARVNVATFSLGREKQGGDAICFAAIDDAISAETLAAIENIPMVKRARCLHFA